jgi:hypothetical protein
VGPAGARVNTGRVRESATPVGNRGTTPLSAERRTLQAVASQA